jgi:putative glutamine amidotransferase
MEMISLDKAVHNNIPILGICRGIQFINAALGGTLYQDLPSERPSDIEHHQTPPYYVPVHDVQIVKDSPLYDLIQNDILAVNSYHHQAIKKLSPKLAAMAFSQDGLIEAIYKPDNKFLWALQWHPEFSYKTDKNSKMIFELFVSNCNR